MNKPVLFGAGACGLLLVGLILRPVLWSGGDRPSGAEAESAHSSSALSGWDTAQYETLSEAELRRESDRLWQQAIGIQSRLHSEPTAGEREILLGQLGDVVERSNRVTTLLGN